MQDLIQREQIMQLIELIKDNGQEELVTKMYRNLEAESLELNAVLEKVAITDNQACLQRIHGVKNLFGIFGAFQISALLDKIYQNLKNPENNQELTKQYTSEYNTLVPITLASIRSALRPWVSA